MKKLIMLTALAAAMVSCATPSKIVSTSTSANPSVNFKTTETVADVQVEGTKISFLFVPSIMVTNGGYDNVIKTAVREALLSVGEKYDVLMAKETLVKYNEYGQIESVLVTGYPACYTNWRTIDKVSQVEEERDPEKNPFSLKK